MCNLVAARVGELGTAIAARPIGKRGLLAGKRLLLLEDQPLIALDMESLLLDFGADDVTSLASPGDALAWLHTHRPDMAVLDIQLGRTTCHAVAEMLAVSGIPFVFVTGYGDNAMISDRFADAPVVRKPYTVPMIETALAECLGG